MSKILMIFLFLVTGIVTLNGQPSLRIEPRTVRFEDVFSRFDYTFLINEGDQTLVIDSLTNIKPFYLLDFENYFSMPIFLNPGDTVKLNITLTNFFNITVADTIDSIFIYSNDPESPRDLRIKIDFFDDDYGLCTGKITDNQLNPLPESKVYFFYYGLYLFDSTTTDIDGNYLANIPKGDYTVAGRKDGYRLIFSGDTPDPFYAQQISIDSGQTINLDLRLLEEPNMGYSVSGTVLSAPVNAPIKKGVVIVRKGTHTPTLPKINAYFDTSNVFAALTSEDGTYRINVLDSSYYFIQAFSSYFLPTYYNSQNTVTFFWNNSDSVLINSILTNKNVYLLRDSSYGAGSVYGNISLPSSEGDYQGITLLAESVTNGSFYAYNFGKEDGKFSISNLPYGTYRIVAQKFGFENTTSNQFTIDLTNKSLYNVNINFDPTSVDDEPITPDEIILYNNFPNPFNPSTLITFSIPESKQIIIKIYNLLGELVVEIMNDLLPAGKHFVRFDADGLPSGVYLCQIQASETIKSQKIMFLK